MLQNFTQVNNFPPQVSRINSCLWVWVAMLQNFTQVNNFPPQVSSCNHSSSIVVMCVSFTLHNITSHMIITSYNIASRHIKSHHITSHNITSHLIIHLILSDPIVSYLVLSHGKVYFSCWLIRGRWQHILSQTCWYGSPPRLDGQCLLFV